MDLNLYFRFPYSKIEHTRDSVLEAIDQANPNITYAIVEIDGKKFLGFDAVTGTPVLDGDSFTRKGDEFRLIRMGGYLKEPVIEE
jgi:hypothetical protein